MISLIAAMARNRVIGFQGQLPWNIPEDLKYFRDKTAGHPVVMGRKTYESIGKPLPKRTNIVVTRDPGFREAHRVDGAVFTGSLEEALERASADGIPGREEIFVIGGGEIYLQALPRAERIYLTTIDREYEGDAYFPELDWPRYRVISRDRREGDPSYEFLVLERGGD